MNYEDIKLMEVGDEMQQARFDSIPLIATKKKIKLLDLTPCVKEDELLVQTPQIAKKRISNNPFGGDQAPYETSRQEIEGRSSVTKLLVETERRE